MSTTAVLPKTTTERHTDLIGLLKKRVAERSFRDEPVTTELLKDIQAAIRLTPSGYNKQPWRYIFAITEEGRSAVLDTLTASNQQWASEAPLLIVGYARRGDSLTHDDGRSYYQFELGMASMNLMLAATNHQLVARPLSGFDPDKIRSNFNLDEDVEPWIVIAVGHPAEHLLDENGNLPELDRQRLDVDEFSRVA